MEEKQNKTKTGNNKLMKTSEVKTEVHICHILSEIASL